MPTKQLLARGRYQLAVAFWLFQRSLEPEKVNEDDARLEEDKLKFSRIRCPLCKWQPDAFSRWQCNDCGHPEFFVGGCGTIWNTFDTRGLCPGCGHQWRWTCCLSCLKRSLHEDWYAKDAD